MDHRVNGFSNARFAIFGTFLCRNLQSQHVQYSGKALASPALKTEYALERHGLKQRQPAQ